MRRVFNVDVNIDRLMAAAFSSANGVFDLLFVWYYRRSTSLVPCVSSFPPRPPLYLLLENKGGVHVSYP